MFMKSFFIRCGSGVPQGERRFECSIHSAFHEPFRERFRKNPLKGAFSTNKMKNEKEEILLKYDNIRIKYQTA